MNALLYRRLIPLGIVLMSLAGACACAAAEDAQWGIGFDGGIMEFRIPFSGTFGGDTYYFRQGLSLRHLDSAGWEVVLTANPGWSRRENQTDADEIFFMHEGVESSGYDRSWARLTVARHLRPWRRLTCAVDLGALYARTDMESAGAYLWDFERPSTFTTHSRSEAWFLFAGLRPVLRVSGALSLEFGYWLGLVTDHYEYARRTIDAATGEVLEVYGSERRTSGWAACAWEGYSRLSAVIWF